MNNKEEIKEKILTCVEAEMINVMGMQPDEVKKILKESNFHVMYRRAPDLVMSMSIDQIIHEILKK